jgi:hypothetical protein
LGAENGTRLWRQPGIIEIQIRKIARHCIQQDINHRKEQKEGQDILSNAPGYIFSHNKLNPPVFIQKTAEKYQVSPEVRMVSPEQAI